MLSSASRWGAVVAAADYPAAQRSCLTREQSALEKSDGLLWVVHAHPSREALRERVRAAQGPLRPNAGATHPAAPRQFRGHRALRSIACIDRSLPPNRDRHACLRPLGSKGTSNDYCSITRMAAQGVHGQLLTAVARTSSFDRDAGSISAGHRERTNRVHRSKRRSRAHRICLAPQSIWRHA